MWALPAGQLLCDSPAGKWLTILPSRPFCPRTPLCTLPTALPLPHLLYNAGLPAPTCTRAHADTHPPLGPTHTPHHRRSTCSPASPSAKAAARARHPCRGALLLLLLGGTVRAAARAGHRPTARLPPRTCCSSCARSWQRWWVVSWEALLLERCWKGMGECPSMPKQGPRSRPCGPAPGPLLILDSIHRL